MSQTYQMPTFGDVQNIISTSVEGKDVIVYNTTTWFNKNGRHYVNAFRITEMGGTLIIEQTASGNTSENSWQVYVDGALIREAFVKPVHKAMMDFMAIQYLNCNLPELNETVNFEDVKPEDQNSDVFVKNPFA